MNQPDLNIIHNESCRTGLLKYPEKIFHTSVTSPPYWGLRDYGSKPEEWPEMEYSILGFPVKVPAWNGQLGLEPDPKMFVGHIVAIMREVHRVLRDDGTLWLNFGDSYAGGGRAGNNPENYGNHQMFGKTGWDPTVFGKAQKITDGLKAKDLIGIPWMVAFALRDDGWYLRQDIIWNKPNPMPESCTDRCTKAHEYIFLFSKSKKYFYDQEAIKTEAKNPIDDIRRILKATENGKSTPTAKKNGIRKPAGWDTDKGAAHGSFHKDGRAKEVEYSEQQSTGANKRSVWTVATKPYKEAHFATFPPELIIDCIKAGAPEFACAQCGAPHVRIVEKELVPTSKAAKTFVVDDRDKNADKNDQGSNRQKDGHKSGYCYQSKTTGYKPTCACKAEKVPGKVLDPFSGAGTTFIVSRKLNRDCVAYEIKPEYFQISDKRTHLELGLFK